MGKIEQKDSSGEQSQKTKEFIKKNWPVALAIAGAAGAVGAAVWLTARFLREKKHREAASDKALEMVENEVEIMNDPTATVIEAGSLLGQVVGDEAANASEELAQNIDDPELSEMLRLVGYISLEKSEKKKR